MGLPIKLSAKLPKDLPLNGLDTIHEQLRTFGTARVVMDVACYEVVDRLGGDKQPIMVIEHIEGLPRGALDKEGERLIARARDTSRGRDVTIHAMPGYWDVVGISDGTDASAGRHRPDRRAAWSCEYSWHQRYRHLLRRRRVGGRSGA